MQWVIKIVYAGAWAGCLVGLARSLFTVAHPLDRWAVVLSYMALALLGFYDYRARAALTQDFTEKSIALCLLECVGVFAYAFTAWTYGFSGSGGSTGVQAFRCAVFCFFLYASTAAAYWMVLYGDKAAFEAMRKSPVWADFVASPGVATALTEALYLPTAIVAFIIFLRPHSFIPYGKNGLWTVSAWLSLVPFFYGLFGPVQGRTKWLFPWLLLIQFAVIVSPIRASIRCRMSP